MFKFFEVIGEFIVFISDMTVNIFQSAIELIARIAHGIQFVFATVGYLPPFCQGAIFAIIGISILALTCSIFIDFG